MFQYSILCFNDRSRCGLSLLTTHAVNPGCRGSGSQPYPTLNRHNFSLLVSQQPLLSYASSSFKKWKTDHQQNDLDLCRFCADAQWEKIGHPDPEGQQIKPLPPAAHRGLVRPPAATEAISVFAFLCDQHAYTATELCILSSTSSFYSCSHPAVNLETNI